MNKNISQYKGQAPWSKPSIHPLKGGAINKFGSRPHTEIQDNVDGVPIKDLMKQYGSPLFVISEKKQRENARRIQRAFSSRYPHVQFGWSYKTNYLNAVCNVFHQEGLWAEVVSEFEYQKARSLGVPGHKIIFNGPHKSREILEQSIEEGALIHIDHMDELFLIDTIATEKKKAVPVAIRLNFDTGYTENWGRFGFNIESGHAFDAAVHISNSQHLKLVGLHSHIGTFITDGRAYVSQIEIMCKFMNEVESKTNCSIDYIDIGGGLASMNSLQGAYLPPEQYIPSIEQYAALICDALIKETKNRNANNDKNLLLILETGRAMIDDAEVLLTSVVANKQLPDGRRATIMDAGLNLLFTSFWYNHKIVPTRELPGTAEETVLYGPLCMNIDVVRKSIQLPPLKIGEPMVIQQVGAYNNTQWMQFIEYRPNVIMIHEDKSVSIVRDAENLQSMTAQERLPAHLSDPFVEIPKEADVIPLAEAQLTDIKPA
ncbi:MAG: alanine racemase [Gammaproteobacteria bacterium]